MKRDTNLQHPNLNLVDPDKGDMWMTMQLQVSVGEKIYGLGERFGPFVKNGQVGTDAFVGTYETDVVLGCRNVERGRRNVVRIDV